MKPAPGGSAFIHPWGKGRFPSPHSRMSPPPSAAGQVTVCLAFQTEVQILKDEEVDALGKESWGPFLRLPHSTSYLPGW